MSNPIRGKREYEDVAYSYTFGEWLAAAGRQDSASEYDLRAAWRAGEAPAEYRRPIPQGTVPDATGN